jgi:peptide/nickel transport system permease protein
MGSAVARARKPVGFWGRSWQQFRANPAGLASAAVLLLIVVAAVAGPMIAEALGLSPTDQDLTNTFAPPSAEHWLGTDAYGRDTLVRIVYGTRVSLTVAALTVTLAFSLGAIIGVIAGYKGGVADATLMRVVDVVLAVPPLLFFMMLAVLFRPDIVSLALILASIGWLTVARLVRSEILTVKQLDFVLASRTLGARDSRLVVRHLLPASVPVMLVAASVSVGAAILSEAALGYLGVGIQPPTPTLGNMIAEGQFYMARSIYPILFPGAVLFVTVLSVTILGNALRDAMDPRLYR